jgi:DNA polymerase V
VVVLSNNDGCVVARSNEVKALGVKMGTPWFQLKRARQKHGIQALSSNYGLYADMSSRMMTVLGRYAPDQEVYSIDECFLGFDGFSHFDLIEHSHRLREEVRRWVGIPVCVGIGATKTLAKLANHCAKKSLAGADGVCDLTRLDDAERSRLFAAIPVNEVWGVGRRLTEQLAARNIHSVEQLRGGRRDSAASLLGSAGAHDPGTQRYRLPGPGGGGAEQAADHLVAFLRRLRLRPFQNSWRPWPCT